jgi:hypothetical protein
MGTSLARNQPTIAKANQPLSTRGCTRTENCRMRLFNSEWTKNHHIWK